MKFAKTLVLGLTTVALSALPAMADSATYWFTSDHCTNGCSTGAANMGVITLTQTAAQLAAGTVSVDVQLEAGFGFVSTGAGAPMGGTDASFFFRLLGNPTITYSNIVPSSSWTIPNVIGTAQQAAGSYAGDGLANQFEYALACNPPGSPPGCGSGVNNLAPPLDFNVTATGLTLASFDDTGNASGSPFGADVISSNGRTGLIDGSFHSQSCTDNCTPPPPVPEPSSVLLLGTPMFGILVLLRRRFGKQT
jgi:hypothetical protein